MCPDSTVKNTFGKLCQICFKYPVNPEIDISCHRQLYNECYLTWIHIAKECPKCSFYMKNDQFAVSNRMLQALKHHFLINS